MDRAYAPGTRLSGNSSSRKGSRAKGLRWRDLALSELSGGRAAQQQAGDAWATLTKPAGAADDSTAHSTQHGGATALFKGPTTLCALLWLRDNQIATSCWSLAAVTEPRSWALCAAPLGGPAGSVPSLDRLLARYLRLRGFRAPAPNFRRRRCRRHQPFVCRLPAMGVKQLWPLLRAEGLVEWYRGGLEGEYGTCLSEVDGTAVAVDLAAWLVQASGGQALPRVGSRHPLHMKAKHCLPARLPAAA